MDRELNIHIDGASKGNPGPSGIGVVVREEGCEPQEISESIGVATTNQAEYRALLRALEVARERGCRQVAIHSDSALLVRQMKGESRVRDPGLRPVYEAALRLARQADVRFVAISREANRQADQLARRASQGEAPRPRSRLHEGDDDLQQREAVQRSAGGVVYKKEGGTLKVCLISKRGGNVWALPKGRVDEGESPEDAARREVLEETGHLAEVGERISEIDYHFYWKENRTLYHKLVSFYLMPVLQECVRDPDGEADAVAWFSLGDAYRKLSYLNEKEVLRQAQGILRTANA